MKFQFEKQYNIKCYDSGDKFLDRYTVIYLNCQEARPNSFTAVGMSDDPFHPQGFGQHCVVMVGKHLGKRIEFKDLPENCQKLVKQDLDIGV